MLDIQNEIVLGHWDPELYRSKIWIFICVFGMSFRALHLISWNTAFPTIVEQWLWCGTALALIVTLLIFIHSKKVVLQWDGILTVVSIVSPVLYLLSRVVMMAGCITAFRAAEPAIYDKYVVANY
jgi:hypothetical protein